MVEPSVINPPPPPPPPRKSNYLWLLILIPICCLCVVILAGAGYLIYKSNGNGFSVPFLGTPKPDYIRVGCYNTEEGYCTEGMTGAIEAAGYDAVSLTSLTAADLQVVQVLMVMNPNYEGYADDYLSSLSAIDLAVKNGVVLLIFDRYVTEAASILPGGQAITVMRALDNPIDIADPNNSVVNGPGGQLNNDSLDSGNYSRHGYASVGSLPAGAVVILSTGDPSQAVMFSYRYGTGYVIYSAIPLDYYLDNTELYAFTNILAPNSIKYAVDLFQK